MVCGGKFPCCLFLFSGQDLMWPKLTLQSGMVWNSNPSASSRVLGLHVSSLLGHSGVELGAASCVPAEYSPRGATFLAWSAASCLFPSAETEADLWLGASLRSPAHSEPVVAFSPSAAMEPFPWDPELPQCVDLQA